MVVAQNEAMLKYVSAFSSFSTPDIQEAKKFYGQTLGLDVKERPEGLEITIKGGGSVFIYASADNRAADYTVLNFIVEDIDSAVAMLEGKGVRMQEYDMPGIKTDEKGIFRNDGSQPGPKAIAWFKDPAQNILAVLQES